MKRLLPFLAASALIISCNSTPQSTDHSDSLKNDSAALANMKLEDLLTIPNEKALAEKFGKEHVSYDTIWGPEGAFTMGSFINHGKADEVEIMWKDSAGRSTMSVASINASYDPETGKLLLNNKWESRTGVRLGMTSAELEKLNGKAFIFSGLDWDYGGGVSFEEGNLFNKNVGVTLGHNPNEPELSEPEFDQILGDRDVKSDNEVVRKALPIVSRISVWR